MNAPLLSEGNGSDEVDMTNLQVRFEKEGPDGLSAREFELVIADFASRGIQIVAEQTKAGEK